MDKKLLVKKKRRKQSNAKELKRMINSNMNNLEEIMKGVKINFYPSEESNVAITKTTSIFHLPKVVQRYIFQYLPVESMASMGLTCKSFGKMIYQMMEEKKKALMEVLQVYLIKDNSEEIEEEEVREVEILMNNFKSELIGLLVTSNFDHSTPNQLKQVFKIKKLKLKREGDLRLILERNMKSEFSEKVPFVLKYHISYKQIMLKIYPTKSKLARINRSKYFELNKLEISHNKCSSFYNIQHLNHFHQFYESSQKANHITEFLYANKGKEFVGNYFLSLLSEHPSFSSLPLDLLFPRILQHVMDQKRKDLEEEKRKLEEVEDIPNPTQIKKASKKTETIDGGAVELNRNDLNRIELNVDSLILEEDENRNAEIEELYIQTNDIPLDFEDYEDQFINSEEYDEEYYEPRKKDKLSSAPHIPRLNFDSSAILTFIFNKICSHLNLRMPCKDGRVELDKLTDEMWETFSSLSLDTNLIPLDNLLCEDLDSILQNPKSKSIFIEQILKILLIRCSYDERYFPKKIVKFKFFFF